MRPTVYFISQSMRRLRVKLILPALTEATSPYWRPIKYSLFPPLGLATLAAFLAPDDEAVLVDEHEQTLDIDDRPDLVLIQAYITNAYRAYRIADRYRRRCCVSRPGGTDVSAISRRVPRRPPAGGVPVGVWADAGPPASGAPRSDRAVPLPGAEFHRGHARVPGALRLLLQGRVLRGRSIVLHAARG